MGVELSKLPICGASRKADPAEWLLFEEKMKAEGLTDAAIAAFKYNFGVLTSGANLMIPEASVKPVASLPDYTTLTAEDPALLKCTVMVKLNGGLGTGKWPRRRRACCRSKARTRSSTSSRSRCCTCATRSASTSPSC